MHTHLYETCTHCECSLYGESNPVCYPAYLSHQPLKYLSTVRTVLYGPNFVLYFGGNWPTGKQDQRRTVGVMRRRSHSRS